VIAWSVLKAIEAFANQASYVGKNLDPSSRDTLLDFLDGEPDMPPILDMLDDWYMKRARDGLGALYDALWGEERKRSW
jgi:hypothetical protein